MTADEGADSVPVVVVGAGPTGLTAATLLAQQGVRTVVVERHDDVYPLPRAVHLDDEVCRILQKLGVAEAFAGMSRPAAGLRLLDPRLRTMAEFRRTASPGVHGWPEANMFDQPDLDRLLRDNLGRNPLVELRWGVELTTVELTTAEPGGPTWAAGLGEVVRVRLRDTATDATQELLASAVLGCDGAGSTVRSLIGASMRDLRFEQEWLVVDVRCGCPVPMWDGVSQVCDPRQAATFMRIGLDRYRFEFRVRPDDPGPELVADRLAPWLGGLPPGSWQILRHARYTFAARIADRWRHGPVFLLGDAAHLSPPFIGQGLGAGLRDADNLVWKLTSVLRGADPRLLDTYQHEREPAARRLILAAAAVGWAMTGGAGRASRVRRALLTAVCRLPGVPAAALRGIAPPLGRSPLVPRRALGRRGLVGRPVPQPYVTIGGRRHRLDDVLGPGFAAIVTGPVDPELAAVTRRLGGRLIRVVDPDRPPRPTEGVIDVVDASGRLAGWLARGNTTAVLLRPDRMALATRRYAAATALLLTRARRPPRPRRTAPPAAPVPLAASYGEVPSDGST